MSSNEEQNLECPLCMEPLEMDDVNFFPCTCGYQICRFCWHRIRTDENGLCPACRKQYPEDPADFKPLSIEELQKIKNEKKQKDLQRKQKISENRKHLANVRVVQRNLVFVVGLPPRLAEAETLKKHEYFGKFGKIHKVVVNNSTVHSGSQGTHSQGGQSASAYVTYLRAEDALRAIQAVNNIHVDSRTLKASLGTTKYCSHFLKNQQCPKPDCMYLHELGDEEASFTKEEMQHGKHQEYEKKLHDQMLNSTALLNRKQTPSPVNQQTPKELWPCLQGGSNKGEKTLNGLTRHQTVGDSCSKEQGKGSVNSNIHQGGKCRHGSGEEIACHKSKKSRERSSDDKQHKGSKERTHKHNNNNNNNNNNSSNNNSINPVLQHMGGLEPISSQSVSTARPSSCGSSSGTDSSTHSSTSSLNCSSDPNPVSWPTSSPSNDVSVPGCVNPNATNSPGSLSPSLSESPVQSTPYGSLSSNGNTAPSPPPPPAPSVTAASSCSAQQGLGWRESPSCMSDILPGYPVNQTSLQLSAYENSFLNGTISSLQSTQHHPQTRLLHTPSHMVGKLDNGLSPPGMMYGMNGVSRLQNGDWSRTGTPLSLCQDIPVNSSSSSTDWQAAFGFGPTNKSQDDDLGFDPWDESSKGLADLLEKEAVRRPPQHTYPFSPLSHSQHPLSQQHQHSLLLKQQQQQLQMLGGGGSAHFGGGGGGPMDQVVNGIPPSQQPQPQQRRVAPPPPGFTPNHVTTTFPSLHRLPFTTEKTTANSKLIGQHPLGGCGGPPFYSAPSSQDELQSSQLRPGLQTNHLKQQASQNCIPPHLRPKLSEAYGNTCNVKDWQDGLRSLLPNISISFGPSPSSQSVGALSSATPQKNNLWNGQSPDLSWSTQDSSILSSSSVSDFSGRETPPHWMKSLQQLTLEDGSVAYSNHHIPHSPLFAYRGGSGASISAAGLPPPSSSSSSSSSSAAGGTQGPPPGFTAPLRTCETHKITENL